MNITEIKIRSWQIFCINFLLYVLVILTIIENINILIFNYFCILYLLIIPGFIISALLLKKDIQDFTTAIVISLGLSIFFITSICLVANSVLPLLGIQKPIQKFYLIVLVFCILIMLSIIFVKNVNLITIKVEYDRSILLLILILALSIIGTLILKKDNKLILFSFVLLAIMPFLCHFKIIPKKSYTFAVWMFALSCVFYNSLFGEFMRATDNMSEIFMIKEYVLKNQIWKNKVPNNILAMPNVVLLIPFLSFFTGDIVSTYKYIVPFISSFIPVIIYKALESKYGQKSALYSALFFSSLFIYFTWASITMKMVTAGLFLSLIFMLLLREGLNYTDKRITLAVFSVSLIFSHYGTAAIFAITLIVTYLLSFAIKNKINIHQFNFGNYILFYVVSYYGYSIYATNGSIFNSVTTTIYNTIIGIENILNPKKNYGAEIVLENVPMYLQIMKVLYILAFIFIIIGLINEFIKKWKNKDVNEFLLIPIVLAGFTVIPYVFPVGQYAGGRIWYISIIFTAPFLVTGFKVLSTKISKSSKLFNILICLFLSIFFIFNSGLASELIWKYNVGPSIYISYPRIIKSGNLWEKEYLDRVTLGVRDVVGAHWLRVHMDYNKRIYADKNGLHNLAFFGLNRGDIKKKLGSLPNVWLIPKYKSIRDHSYIYLTEFDTKNNVIKVSGKLKPELINLRNEINFNEINKIYTNDGCEIYYKY